MLFSSYNLQVTLPLYSSLISAGFPSPAEEYVEQPINLNQFLIKKPAATFLMRHSGTTMVGAGIFPNDVLVVDRSLTPKNQDLVVATIDGSLQLKRIVFAHNAKPLLLEEPAPLPNPSAQKQSVSLPNYTANKKNITSTKYASPTKFASSADLTTQNMPAPLPLEDETTIWGVVTSIIRTLRS